MTLPLTPLVPLPTPPNSITRVATFNADSDATFGALPALVSAYNANIPGMEAVAALAPLVFASREYKAPWAGMTGALPTPASASHNDKLYMLLESLADVTLEEPGVSLKWAEVSFEQSVELLSAAQATGATYVEYDLTPYAADYCAVRIAAEGLMASVSSTNLIAQVKQNGAWQTTINYGTGAGGYNSSSMAMPGALQNSITESLSFVVEAASLGLAARGIVDFKTRQAGTVMFGVIFPSVSPTTPIQGIRFYAATGTLTGKFRFYGVRK